MNEAYEGLEPAEIWRHFDALNGIPRGSKHEAAARDYVLKVASDAGLKSAGDPRGNVVVYVPATAGRAEKAVVIVQSHLDMVLNPAQSPTYDGLRDPIVPRREGDAIYGSGTTLGADNGIGVAAMLALITTPNLDHGPLELLFTIEEEIGLLGAAEIDAAALSGRRLINLDSEDLGVITIGCAGGRTYAVTIPVTPEDTTAGYAAFDISLSGLRGGHSGVEIATGRANSIKLLTHLLSAINAAGIDWRLAAISGGEARNAIPAAAAAQLIVSAEDAANLKRIVSDTSISLHEAWGEGEPDLKLSATPASAPASCWTIEDANRVLSLLEEIPTGVVAMSLEFEGKVQTSQNLAVVQSAGSEVTVAVSTRSFLEGDLDQLEDALQQMAQAVNGSCHRESGYPGWPPAGGSPLLTATSKALEATVGKAPEIEVVHAGLECGVIAAQLPGLEAVSFGPDIRDAHRTTEHILFASVEPFWRSLLLILSD